MRKFLGRTKNPLALEAMSALGKLLEAKGLDLVERAAAEVTAPARKALVFKDYQESPASACVQRLRNKRGCPHSLYSAHDSPHRAPGADHDRILLKEGKPAVYISEPYGIGWDELQELVDFCRKYGLTAEIDARRSAHFPGSTVSVWIKAKSNGEGGSP